MANASNECFEFISIDSEDITYLSMMVHPDNEKVWNKKFKNWIEKELQGLKEVRVQRVF